MNSDSGFGCCARHKSCMYVAIARVLDSLYGSTYVCVYVCMYVRVYVYVRMYVCTYVYTYVCMYVFVPVWNHFAFLGSSCETRRIQDPSGKGRISNFNFEISTLAGFLGVVVRLRPIPPP